MNKTYNSPGGIIVSSIQGKQQLQKGKILKYLQQGQQNSLQNQHRKQFIQSITVKAEQYYNFQVDPQVDQKSYIALGISNCFELIEKTMHDKFVIEPINASSLECMAVGAPTSFKHVFGTQVDQALTKDRDNFPEEFNNALFCENYDVRVRACARTWLRQHAQDNLMDIVPLNKLRSNFNFNTKNKRVLNFKNIVDDNDNIKQDISIDVYGRQAQQEEQEKVKQAEIKQKQLEQEKQKEQEKEGAEEDELDALLNV